jgi:hypothetical protein
MTLLMSFPSSTHHLSPKRIIGGAFKKLNFFICYLIFVSQRNQKVKKK